MVKIDFDFIICKEELLIWYVYVYLWLNKLQISVAYTKNFKNGYCKKKENLEKILPYINYNFLKNYI